MQHCTVQVARWHRRQSARRSFICTFTICPWSPSHTLYFLTHFIFAAYFIRWFFLLPKQSTFILHFCRKSSDACYGPSRWSADDNAVIFSFMFFSLFLISYCMQFIVEHFFVCDLFLKILVIHLLYATAYGI